MNIKQFTDIKKEIINQSILVPEIKFINFTGKQINKYKKSPQIVIVRKQSQVNNINLGDFVKPEWGKIYQVTDVQLINDITQFKDYGLIDPEILADLLGEYKQIFKVIKLTKFIKKNIRRYFYDCNFDQTNHGLKLISIGIVDEKYNELFLINKDYNWELTSRQLFENVYPIIKSSPDYYKLSLDLMKDKVLQFIKPTPIDDIKLYSFCGAFNHVLLYQLLGNIDGMPKYTNELKQIIDYFGINIKKLLPDPRLNKYDVLSNAKWNCRLYNAIVNLLQVKI